MFSTLINEYMLAHLITELVMRQHTSDRLCDPLNCILLTHHLGASDTQTIRILGMREVELLEILITSDTNLICINDDYIIAAGQWRLPHTTDA